MTLPRLDKSLLGEAASELDPPQYDRTGEPAVIHIGCGAFHRAHQAAYFDELLRLGDGKWLIQGVSLQTQTAQGQLNPQDGLFTLVERDSDCVRARIIGSIQGVMNPQDEPAALVKLLARPATQLVTLTITEKGYCIDPTSGALQLDDPAIQADITNPGSPVTAPGYIVAGLAARKALGLEPFTVLSCDNLSDNGGKTRAAVLALAAQSDPDLAGWIDEFGAFPSSMVDRITPAVTSAGKSELQGIAGYRDEAMVETEMFTQWIVEDWFCGDRPPLEKVGVQMTSNVESWEAVKLRLLNGTHSSLAYLGGLLGYPYVHEAVADPELAQFIERLWAEIEPTLPKIEGFDAQEYTRQLLRRFTNASLSHELFQISIDGSQKLPQRLLKPLSERLASGQSSPAIELVVASWIRWQFGRDFAGREYQVQDARAELYGAIVRNHGDDFVAIVDAVAKTGLFGDVNVPFDGLAARLAKNLRALSGSDADNQCRKMLNEIA